MRVAVSAVEPSVESKVDPRFGRCAWFVLVEPETMAFEVLENSSGAAAQGAGIATAQMIAGRGVEAVLTGNCGPNAYDVLAAAGIGVVTGVAGTVRDAAKAYRDGGLQSSARPNVASHHGMGMSPARGMGYAGSPPTVLSDASGAGITELLLELKGQLDALREQVSDINHRIEELHQDK